MQCKAATLVKLQVLHVTAVVVALAAASAAIVVVTMAVTRVGDVVTVVVVGTWVSRDSYSIRVALV